MAKYAYRVPNGTENDRVDASDLPLHGNGTFYCTTPDCRARRMCALRKSQVRVL